ncbi:ATP-binding protein [Novosphingobium sp. PhB55]|uniref:ATP-binding protein n=1 Tax=unclassified Novosphingobium TaxID=2644732 RepID=UPI001066918A|nr:ATP-binding protein [Novosphingobium sp. PhB55]TDW67174.1 signal transduction histidine kinase [Novosphingobium sp. PhB55]
MPTHSILRRILLLHAAATLVTAVLAAWGAMLLIDSTGDRLQRQILDEYAQKMQHGLHRQGGGWTISEETASALRGGGSSFSFWIEDEGRPVAIENLRSDPSLSVPMRAGAAYFKRVRGPRIYSGVSMPLMGERGSWLVIVQNLDHPDVIFDDLRADIAVVGGVLLAVFLVGLLAVDAYIVRQSLAPLKRASRQVGQVSPYQLQQRVDTAGMPEEVVPLLQAINAALDRVEEAYRIERDFAADAAHELRTPLAILRLLVEQDGAPEAVPRLQRQIDALEAMVERLLLLAEVDAMACDPGEVTDLRVLAEERVAGIAPLFIARGQEIEIVGAESVPVFAAHHLAARALDSLLENAMKHTPAGTHVVVTVDPAAEIRVADDGPGLPPVAAGDELFARFSSARRDFKSGSGLGLAIASELMARTGGNLEAAENRPRGTVFRMRFHPVPTAARGARRG